MMDRIDQTYDVISNDLEAIINQQIHDKESILDIRTNLIHAQEVQLSLGFGVSLAQKLVTHAIEFSGNNNNDIDEYSLAINDIFQALDKFNVSHAKEFARNIMEMIREYAMEEVPLQHGSSRIIAIALLTTASAQILSSTPTHRISSQSAYRKLYSYAWGQLPTLLDACSETPDSLRYILKGPAQFCQVIIDNNGFWPDQTRIEDVMRGFLTIMIEISDDFNRTYMSPIMDILFNCLNVLAREYPRIVIVDPQSISSLLEQLVQLENMNKILHQESILNTACILLRNGVYIRWLPRYLDLVNEQTSIKTSVILARSLLNELGPCDDTLEVGERFAKRLRVQSTEDMELDEAKRFYSKRLIELLELEPFRTDEAELIATIPDLVDDIVFAEDEDANGAFEQIKEVSAYTQKSMTVLLYPYEKQLAHYASKCLVTNFTMAENIASLYDRKLGRYLQSKMRYVLPFAVSIPDDYKVLGAVANSLGLDVQSLCIQDIHYILVDLLMNEDELSSVDKFARISDLIGSKQSLTEIMSLNMTKLAILLVLELGWPTKKDKAFYALKRLIQLCDYTPDMTVGKYISFIFVGILDTIGKFISEKRCGVQVPTHPQALRAMEEVIDIILPSGEAHALQLMTTIQNIGDIPKMQRNAVKLWSRLIHALDSTALSLHINTIVNGLLSMITQCDRDVKAAVAQEIFELFTDKCVLTSAILDQLVDIPPFEELATIRILIEGKRHQLKTEMDIRSVIEQAHSQDAADILTSLRNLCRLLDSYDEIEDQILKDRDDLYTTLLTLARTHTNREDIRGLLASCLGRLGATDPSQVDVRTIEESVIILGNYKNETENREFVCDLVERHLVPAFHKAADEHVRQRLQYTMQMLIRQSGFTVKLVDEPGTVDNDILSRWTRFPTVVRSILIPLLSSSFTCSWEISIYEYPIYDHSQTYSDWLRKWYYNLVESVESKAKLIFSACWPVIQAGNIELAFHLLPYLVVQALVSNTAEKRSYITQEVISVLQIRSHRLSHGEKMTQSSLQVVVHITEYCRKWLRQKQGSTTKRSADIAVVRGFLDNIPNDLMAVASYRSKAYAQALLHLELHLKESMETRGSITSEDMDHLQRIYMHMEDLDGMQAILSMFTRTLRFDEEILRLESTGRYQDARVYYEHALQEKPEDLQVNTGYLDCLRINGEYVTALANANQLILKHPHWLSQINPFRVEAAWKTCDWDTLEQYVQESSDTSFNKLLGGALASCRKGDNINARIFIHKAKMEQMESLSVTTLVSYRQSHDVIFRLQQLQELEDSHIAWENSLAQGDSRPLQGLANRWQKQFRHLSPAAQMRKQLLDLRLTALYKLRLGHSTGLAESLRANAADIWLLTAKTARKAGETGNALSAYLNAESLGAPYAYLERAKLHWKNREYSEAIKFLKSKSNLDAKGKLLLARYSEEIATQERTIISKLYREAINGEEEWEKARYNVGRYHDKLADQKCDIREITVKNESEDLRKTLNEAYMTFNHTIQQAIPEIPPYQAPLESKLPLLRQRCTVILRKLENDPEDTLIPIIVKEASILTKNLKILANEKYDERRTPHSLARYPGLTRLRDLHLCIPREISLLPKLPELSPVGHIPFPDDLPTIHAFGSTIEIMRSLQQPKKITVIGNDGRHYGFLCKTNDDLRKDARVMDFSYMINTFLKKDPEARQRQLYIRTYAVIPLGEQWGLIEWINNLNPLKTIVGEEWLKIGIQLKSMYAKVKQILEGTSDSDKEYVFSTEVLPKCPSVFYKWFLENFPEPTQWFAARNRYTKTLAVMSIVGHILGLGDRHTENILFDSMTGDSVHVDVNMLFDKGLALAVPEKVPFRLTKNLVGAMGIMQQEGAFRKSCEVTLQVLRHNKQQLCSVFETLVNDPIIEWQRRAYILSKRDATDVLAETHSAARRQMAKIEEKIDNGRSIEENVAHLINEATSAKNLSVMFMGWAPYI
ncbi:serine/threonine-protein kinase M1 [Apophysomyces sp. BC1015]|nr:serine/threonine-protein kinase M1 [Apophysomyces sp. BC1015]